MNAAPLLAGLLLVAQLSAQDPDQLRGAITRSQRELQQLRGEAEALLDARIRYDLGLPIGGDLEALRGESAATTQGIASAEQQLQQEDATTASLLGRYERLRQQAQQVHTAAQQQGRSARRDEEWITVPVAGADGQQADRAAAALPPGAEPFAVAEAPAVPVSAEPAADPGAAGAMRVVPNLAPIHAQIHGSGDHGLVAQSLFKAAQALMDRAVELRTGGQGAAADQADEEARQRLLRAVAELETVTAGADAAFTDLFHLGKCRELLFRIGERRDGLSLRRDPREYQRREQAVRDPLVAITARDVVRRGGTEQLGPWGRAAQAALDHFRWMNLHAGYVPKADPKAITWTQQAQR